MTMNTTFNETENAHTEENVMQKADVKLTPREILELAVKVGEFVKEEAGRSGKQVSGKDIDTIAGVLGFIHQSE